MDEFCLLRCLLVNMIKKSIYRMDSLKCHLSQVSYIFEVPDVFQNRRISKKD